MSAVGISLMLTMNSRSFAAAQGFDVVSVKRAGAFWPSPLQRSGGRVLWESPNRLALVLYAFHLQRFQVDGLQFENDAYRIDAVTQPNATDDEVRRMMQKMLQERFGLAFHTVDKELHGLALSAAPSGAKVNKAADNKEFLSPYGKPLPIGKVLTLAEHGQTLITGRKVTIKDLCEAIAAAANTPVVDDTRLGGEYDLDLTFVADETRPTKSQVDGPPLRRAVQEQLGLKLSDRKVTTPVVVIDHISRTPTEN